MASNLAKVNALLKAAGRKEVIVRGTGYYYATGGECYTELRSTMICVYSFSDCTLAEVIALVEQLYRENGITVKL